MRRRILKLRPLRPEQGQDLVFTTGTKHSKTGTNVSECEGELCGVSSIDPAHSAAFLKPDGVCECAYVRTCVCDSEGRLGYV